MLSKGFIFDYSKCVGCHACIVACYNENKTNPCLSWRQINSFNAQKVPLAGFINLSIACNHCNEAPCLKSCPAKAYERDNHTGAVIHNSEKCIGCRYCTWACPFDAPKYNKEKGVVEKCHLCNHLISNDLNPACANQCPTGALSFGTIDSMNSNDQFGIPKTSFEPRIKTVNSEVVYSKSLIDFNLSEKELQCASNNLIKEKVNAIEDWPLVFFTFIFSFLTGWFTSFWTGTDRLQQIIFLLLGVIGILLSTIHLGKPFRAYRSIVNIKTSWLSREIIFCGIFLLFSFTYLFIIQSTILFIITILIGYLFLLTIEMVYSIPKKKFKLPIHSSNTFLTSLLFCFYFNDYKILIVVIVVIKALLYLYQKSEPDLYKILRVLGSFVRVIIGLIFPLSIVFFSYPINYGLLLILLLIGELIDRFEFYENISIDSPSRVLINTFNEILKR